MLTETVNVSLPNISPQWIFCIVPFSLFVINALICAYAYITSKITKKESGDYITLGIITCISGAGCLIIFFLYILATL